jgi:hypothetical protein
LLRAAGLSGSALRSWLVQSVYMYGALNRIGFEPTFVDTIRVLRHCHRYKLASGN